MKTKTGHRTDYTAPTADQIARADEEHDTRRALEFRWIPVLLFWGTPATIISAVALYRIFFG